MSDSDTATTDVYPPEDIVLPPGWLVTRTSCSQPPLARPGGRVPDRGRRST